ncbi:MAG: DUF883 domain-containing protein [Planctomycetes bacterium]|nr:DUF883 domain-containing protein [Planctomycetota bacterium]
MTRNIRRHTTDDFSDGVEKLTEDMERIKTDIADTARDVAGVAVSGVAAAKQGMSEAVETAKEQSRVAAESLAEQIQERPWTSVAIAAGAGILLGLYLSRRKDA